MSYLRNSAFNFLGALVPAVAALLTIPVVIAHLGAEQYGVLVLVTSIVGYFALLDINATAASVKYLSEYQARGDDHRLAQVWTFGLVLYAVIGLLGGALITSSAHAMATAVFTIPEPLLPEAILALQWAGVGFAVSQLQVYLQSVFQAMQRYDLSSAFESFFGIIASLLTLAIVLAGGGLIEIVLARLILGLINCAALAFRIRRLVPAAILARPDRSTVRLLTGFSAYSYLSKIAAITAANSDKLFVGSLVDMRALTFFSVPAMLANRVFGMSFRLSQVLFPMASALSAQDRHLELESTYISATRHIVFLNAGLCLLLTAFAPELLHYWAGKVFGSDAVFILVFLALAFFVDSLTNLPSLFNDGLGRPKFTGVAAVLRAAVGIASAYVAISLYGIRGAAVAQFMVSAVATTAFLVVVHRLSVPVLLSRVVRRGFGPAAVPTGLAIGLGVLATHREPLPLVWFLAALPATVLALCAYGWFLVIDANVRGRLLRLKPGTPEAV